MNQRETIELLMRLSVDHGYLRMPTEDKRAAVAFAEAWHTVTAPAWVTVDIAAAAMKLWRLRSNTAIEKYPILNPAIFRMFLRQARTAAEREENRRDALEVSRRAALGDRRPALPRGKLPGAPLRLKDQPAFNRAILVGKAQARSRAAYLAAQRDGKENAEANEIARKIYEETLNSEGNENE